MPKEDRQPNYIYTPEEIEFLKAYIPGHTHLEIIAEFEKRFKPISNNNLKWFIQKHGVKTGFTGHFHTPGGAAGFRGWEKDSMPKRAKLAWYKKGCTPHNTLPVGSVRSHMRYLKIKIAEPNKWRLLHLHNWEQVNGPIPEGHVITFKDGDPHNCDISNLRMVRKDDFAMVRRFSDTRGEARNAVITYSELRGEIRRKRKNEKHNG